MTRKAFGITEITWNAYSVEERYEFEKLHKEELRVLKQVFFTKYYTGGAITFSRKKIIDNRVENEVSQASKALYKLSLEDRIKRIENYKQGIKENLINWDTIKKEKAEKEKNTNYNPINYKEHGYKVLKYAVIGLVLLALVTCSSRKRVGALCKDGSYSSSTSTGTCSHHNGVSSWKYEYWWE